MNVTLLVITDGRWDYLRRTLVSAARHLEYPFADLILVDDSGHAEGPAPDGFRIVKNPERLGLAGAIQAGWDALAPDTDCVFHLEDDFTFPQSVPVADMIDRLWHNADLAQVALLRQPWSAAEHAAGSIYATDPAAYQEAFGLVWQSKLFTFNPCVYPAIVTHDGAGLEADITDRLVADGYQFAYYGGLGDPPRCIHIGNRRSEGYKW